MFDTWRGFTQGRLSRDRYEQLTEMARQARGHILKMTTVAGSGHPGGSMSSLEVFLVLYTTARVDPGDPLRDDRDRIIISHGHTSPGVYAALGAAGFYDVTLALHGFRQGGSPFEGHVERSIPGVEWDTGNLGQGLSVGVGKAIYARLSGNDFHTYVCMGDGEQQKGQISEARRMAAKYKLTRLTAIVDFNHLQISGRIEDIMPQDIRAEWEAGGWKVIEIDGHDLNQVYESLRTATMDDGSPYMILATSVMGQGVSFMKNDKSFHGSAVKKDRIQTALDELGIENDVEALLARRKEGPPPMFDIRRPAFPNVDAGSPISYQADVGMDNRSAFGSALQSVAEKNMGREAFTMAVFDCDLAGSVKTHGFAMKYPHNFFQCGISEHNAASMAGSLSAEAAVSVWADFGVFGIDETYNQARLNDINHTNLKLFCTHSGVNVGEDGKTHQCIDYFGLFNSTFGWKVITPADPNQTDRAVRYVLSRPGNFAVIMGRSVNPVITDESGRPFFAENYAYRYGRMETIRQGRGFALVAAGNMLGRALEAWDILNAEKRRIALVCVSDWSDLHADDLAMLASYDRIAVLEDHNVRTGLGTAIAATLADSDLSVGITRLGVTTYASSGKPDELFRMLGLDPHSVAARIRALVENSPVGV
ncbi:MAG TPA: transketolase [Acidobacteriota bacterium]|nr:transketolase [Acidobacteriota bacterium]